MSDDLDLSVKHVSVTVDGSNNVICTPDQVVITTANALISFTCDTAGYTFPDTNAIVVTTPHSQFPYSAWTVKPTQAVLFDVNNDAQTYKYTATVVVTATSGTLSVDPTIKNGGIGSGP